MRFALDAFHSSYLGSHANLSEPSLRSSAKTALRFHLSRFGTSQVAVAVARVLRVPRSASSESSMNFCIPVSPAPTTAPVCKIQHFQYKIHHFQYKHRHLKYNIIILNAKFITFVGKFITFIAVPSAIFVLDSMNRLRNSAHFTV